MGLVMGSQNIMGSDYGSNISDYRPASSSEYISQRKCNAALVIITTSALAALLCIFVRFPITIHDEQWKVRAAF
jgi:hypothetical protein